LARAAERVVRRARGGLVDVRLATLRGLEDADLEDVVVAAVVVGEGPDVVVADVFLGSSLRR
jgi:hypothetical protein